MFHGISLAHGKMLIDICGTTFMAKITTKEEALEWVKKEHL